MLNPKPTRRAQVSVGRVASLYAVGIASTVLLGGRASYDGGRLLYWTRQSRAWPGEEFVFQRLQGSTVWTRTSNQLFCTEVEKRRRAEVETVDVVRPPFDLPLQALSSMPC